eukprot:maker-scaffold_2-snap-gene-24.32-mRNA-1 protein AED:0.01 eAED:0.01 QI:71/1/1/1/1/1/2/349/396
MKRLFNKSLLSNLRTGSNLQHLPRRGFSSTSEANAFKLSPTSAAIVVSTVAFVSAGVYFTNTSTKEIPVAETLEPNGLSEKVLQIEVDVANLKLGLKNKAFVFIKPHAVTNEVEELLKAKFDASGIKITKSGEINHNEIDEKLLVDTHYGSIASKAVKLDPAELNLSDKAKADFQKMAGLSWEDALSQKKVLNAMQYSEKTGLNSTAIDAKWSKLVRGENLIKFGGGFYCGDLDGEYVINGFYMAMREKYTAPGKKIKFFTVEFSPVLVSWEKFRNEILGSTDPKAAEPGSLRNEVWANWEKLGLESEPNTGDNGVHASASPFEAFAERVNWLGVALEEDSWGSTLLLNGVDLDKLKAMMGDAPVEYEGKVQSSFDLLEDLDSEDCLEKILDIVKE